MEQAVTVIEQNKHIEDDENDEVLPAEGSWKSIFILDISVLSDGRAPVASQHIVQHGSGVSLVRNFLPSLVLIVVTGAPLQRAVVR